MQKGAIGIGGALIVVVLLVAGVFLYTGGYFPGAVSGSGVSPSTITDCSSETSPNLLCVEF